MGCGCAKKSGVEYEVTFADGSTQRYDTLSEGQAAMNQSRNGTGTPTIRAVTK